MPIAKVNEKEALSLRLYPDPCLLSPCLQVVEFDAVLRGFAQEMGQLMRFHRGVGLAANQVGLLSRLIVVDEALMGRPGDANGTVALVNPVIVEGSGVCDLEEGCLSLPKIRYKVTGRSETVILRFQDLSGGAEQIELHGLAALCVQHEVDHLNGLTMLDRLSQLKASRAKEKLRAMRGRK